MNTSKRGHEYFRVVVPLAEPNLVICRENKSPFCPVTTSVTVLPVVLALNYTSQSLFHPATLIPMNGSSQ